MSAPPRCSRRDGTSEAAPEAGRQAVGGGCRSGWGRLLSVTNANETGTWGGGDSSWAPWKGGYLPPPPMHPCPTPSPPSHSFERALPFCSHPISPLTDEALTRGLGGRGFTQGRLTDTRRQCATTRLFGLRRQSPWAKDRRPHQNTERDVDGGRRCVLAPEGCAAPGGGLPPRALALVAQ